MSNESLPVFRVLTEWNEGLKSFTEGCLNEYLGNVEREVLIENDGYVKFFIDFENVNVISATFTVYRVISWTGDSQDKTDEWKTPSEEEVYLKGYVKYDGCSHFTFGSESGYMHLCGYSDYQALKDVLDAVFLLCSKKIQNWNSEYAK